MRVDKFTYAQVEGCLYEAIRAIVKKGKVEAEREGKALIDTSMSHLNKTEVHDCLKPMATPPKRKNGKLYVKDKDGNEVEYQRGQAIANYHNSQVSSGYQKARMNGSEAQLSKAVGFIVTLPKDYIQSVIPDLTDAEYEYLTNKLEAEGLHKPFTTDEVYETSLRMKFGRHQWTNEEIEKAKDFLLSSKDCVLDEMGIRSEDVLFYSIHFDESFPHLHCMALPTVEKTYEKDVYGGRGGKKLLHKQGDKEITYSIGKFYETNKEGEYIFFKDFHQHIVDKMEEKGFDASGLIQGVTAGDKQFTPSSMDRTQREESVRKAMEIAALQKKIKSMEDALTKAEGLRDTAEAKAAALEEEVAKATEDLEQAKSELTDAKASVEEAKASLEEYEQDKKELIKEIKEQKSIFRDFFVNIKDIIKDLIKNTIKVFLPAWAKATAGEKDKVTSQAKAFISDSLMGPVRELEAKASTLLGTSERYPVYKAGIFLQTPVKVGFARERIKEAAVGTPYEEEFSTLTKENYESSPRMMFCLKDWFNEEKYKEELEIRPTEEQVEYMENEARARRAIGALDTALDMGIDVEEMELG